MEKINVEFMGGSSDGVKAINYMIAKLSKSLLDQLTDEQLDAYEQLTGEPLRAPLHQSGFYYNRLYAEIVIPDDEDDEMYGCEELKAKIIAQAEALGLTETDLNFR